MQVDDGSDTEGDTPSMPIKKKQKGKSVKLSGLADKETNKREKYIPKLSLKVCVCSVNVLF